MPKEWLHPHPRGGKRDENTDSILRDEYLNMLPLLWTSGATEKRTGISEQETLTSLDVFFWDSWYVKPRIS